MLTTLNKKIRFCILAKQFRYSSGKFNGENKCTYLRNLLNKILKYVYIGRTDEIVMDFVD